MSNSVPLLSDLNRWRVAQAKHEAAVEAFEALPKEVLSVDQALQFIARHGDPDSRLRWLM